MDAVREFSKNDKFAEHVGVELMEVSEGYAKAKMEIREHHLNGMGVVHGAAIFSLADAVFAVASNSYGTIAMAINVSISYLKAVAQGALYAQARELSRNPKLASYDIRITNEKDELIAVFQGMVYRKKDRIPTARK